jgi:hypothetical protein
MFANTRKKQVDETLYGSWMRKFQLVVRALGKVYWAPPGASGWFKQTFT